MFAHAYNDNKSSVPFADCMNGVSVNDVILVIGRPAVATLASVSFLQHFFAAAKSSN